MSKNIFDTNTACNINMQASDLTEYIVLHFLEVTVMNLGLMISTTWLITQVNIVCDKKNFIKISLA